MNIKNMKTRAFDVSRTFYFAGLGVTALVAGTAGKTFNNLVEKGQTFSKKEEEAEKEAVEGITTRVKNLTDQAGERLQDGMQATLGRLGIPSRDELHKLTESIEQLSEKIQGLQAHKA